MPQTNAHRVWMKIKQNRVNRSLQLIICTRRIVIDCIQCVMQLKICFLVIVSTFFPKVIIYHMHDGSLIFHKRRQSHAKKRFVDKTISLLLIVHTHAVCVKSHNKTMTESNCIEIAYENRVPYFDFIVVANIVVVIVLSNGFCSAYVIEFA